MPVSAITCSVPTERCHDTRSNSPSWGLPARRQLLPSLGHHPIVEFLIHEEPDRPQPVQFGPDICQETTLLACHQQTDRSNHPKAHRSGKPPRGLFIKNEQRVTQFQTQTDDLAFSRTDGRGHGAWL